MVGSVLFFTLAMTLADCAVIKREVTCNPCNYPPPPPPLVPYYSQQWTGVARSDDGTPQGVFSGAAASMADPQVYSMASSQQNNQYLTSAAQYGPQEADYNNQASNTNNQYTANQETQSEQQETNQATKTNNQYTANQENQSEQQETYQASNTKSEDLTDQKTESESQKTVQQSEEYPAEPQSSDITTTEEPTTTTIKDTPRFAARSQTQSANYEASAAEHFQDVQETKPEIKPIAAAPTAAAPNQGPTHTQFHGVSSHQESSQNFGVQSLHDAMNLAAFGLQAAEHQMATCSTCGKSSLALSNAYSHEGNAIAFAING